MVAALHHHLRRRLREDVIRCPQDEQKGLPAAFPSRTTDTASSVNGRVGIKPQGTSASEIRPFMASAATLRARPSGAGVDLPIAPRSIRQMGHASRMNVRGLDERVTEVAGLHGRPRRDCNRLIGPARAAFPISLTVMADACRTSAASSSLNPRRTAARRRARRAGRLFRAW